MQETWVQPWSRRIPRVTGQPRPVCHNYWACVCAGAWDCSSWTHVPRTQAPQQERLCNEACAVLQRGAHGPLEKSPCNTWGSAQPKMNQGLLHYVRWEKQIKIVCRVRLIFCFKANFLPTWAQERLWISSWGQNTVSSPPGREAGRVSS